MAGRPGIGAADQPRKTARDVMTIKRVKETKMAGHSIETTRLGRASRRIRLQTIVWLRWLAVAGQTATILLVAFGLNFPCRFWPAAS